MESKRRFRDWNPLDLSDFSLNTVSKYISILNGVGTNKITIYELDDLLHLLDYDGKLEISNFDLKIFQSIRNSLLAYDLNFDEIQKLRKVVQLENDLVLDLLDDLDLKQRLGPFFIPDILFRLRPGLVKSHTHFKIHVCKIGQRYDFYKPMTVVGKKMNTLKIQQMVNS